MNVEINEIDIISSSIKEMEIISRAALCLRSTRARDCDGCPYIIYESCTRKLAEDTEQIVSKIKKELRKELSRQSKTEKIYQRQSYKQDLPIQLDEGATLPTRGHDQDAGLDLYSRERRTIPLYESVVFDTGVHVELPPGTCGLLVSKSGLNVEKDLISTGLIDEGYTGSIKVKLYNLGEHDRIISAGQKISQLVVLPVVHCDPVEVTEISGGERGSDGFGSTGE